MKKQLTGFKTPDKSIKIIKNDEIDLIALAKVIWVGRKIMCYSVGVSIIIGLIIAFTKSPIYTSTAVLLPSSVEGKTNLGGIGALAGLAGVNLGAMIGNTTGISSDLYPNIVKSYPFIRDLMSQDFHYRKFDHPISAFEYFQSDSISSFGYRIVKYTVKLPWTLKELLADKNDSTDCQMQEFGVVYLSEQDLKSINKLKEMLFVDIDKKSGLVTIGAEANEPIVVAQYVQIAVKLLQKYVIEYKTKQARENLEFIQHRYNEMKAEYENTQIRFFEYKDRHRNIVSERIDLEFQRLSDDFDIVSTVYKGLAQQLEQAKIAVKEATPAFTVIEPPRIQLERTSPKRMIILVVSFFFGLFIGVGIIFLNRFYSSVLSKYEE